MIIATINFSNSRQDIRLHRGYFSMGLLLRTSGIFLSASSFIHGDLWPRRYPFRGNWEITRQEDLHDSQILTLAPPSEPDTLHHHDDDHSRSKICCRAIAITVSSSFCFAFLVFVLAFVWVLIWTVIVSVSSSSWFFCFFVISFLSWSAGLSSTHSPYSQ